MSLRIRRGGGAVSPPPTAPTFGPTDGAAAIRAGAGARTVTDPGGGISFNSSSSLQTAINNNPAGSVFVCSVNAPLWNSTVNTGTKAPTIIFPGPVGQKVIDGAGADRNAIEAGNNTTIMGGTFQNFGSIHPNGRAVVPQDDCAIQDIVATDCFTHGISVQGLNCLIDHCTLHTNGIHGMQTGNSGLFQTDGLVVRYCNIYGNNTRQQNPGIEGGAHKFLFTGHGHYHHNWVHDNLGFGAWWDTEDYDWTIEENVMEDNWFGGFHYEGCWGSVIRRNYIANNGRNNTIGGAPATFLNTANVRLSDSPADTVAADGIIYPVDFQLNIVDHTLPALGQTGGLLVMRDHTDITPRHVGNHDVHHNQWWIRFSHTLGGRVSRIRPWDEDTVGTPATTNFQIWDLDNTFFNNEYRVVNTTSNFWAWGSGTSIGTDESFAAWSARWSGESRVLI